MIRVVLPAQLRTLARIDGEVALAVAGDATQRSLLDALERRYPLLQGAIRDRATQRRRPFVRFFACGRELSHELPDAVASGAEPLLVVGAMAGGAQRCSEKAVVAIASSRASSRDSHDRVGYYPSTPHVFRALYRVV